MKKIKDMTDREIMEEILKRERRGSVFRILIIILIVANIITAAYFYHYLNTEVLPELLQMYEEYNMTMDQVNLYLAELDELDIDGLQTLIVNMQSTLETIDFEKLKTTIESLQSALQAIGKILNF